MDYGFFSVEMPEIYGNFSEEYQIVYNNGVINKCNAKYSLTQKPILMH